MESRWNPLISRGKPNYRGAGAFRYAGASGLPRRQLLYLGKELQ